MKLLSRLHGAAHWHLPAWSILNEVSSSEQSASGAAEDVNNSRAEIERDRRLILRQLRTGLILTDAAFALVVILVVMTGIAFLDEWSAPLCWSLLLSVVGISLWFSTGCWRLYDLAALAMGVFGERPPESGISSGRPVKIFSSAIDPLDSENR